MTREQLLEFMKAIKGRNIFTAITESGKEVRGLEVEEAVIEQLEKAEADK